MKELKPIIVKEKLDYSVEMGAFIKRLEQIVPFLSWERVSSRIRLKRKLNRYAINFMNRRAAEFSNERFGTSFTIGSHGFLGFRKVHGKPSKKPVMMFRKENIKKIKELGYELDYDLHFKSFVKDKIDYLFDDYGKSWSSLKQKSRISSVLII